MSDNVEIKNLSNALRFLVIDMVNRAKSGHVGMPLGMADIMSVLYTKFLKFNPHDPTWFNRDRVIWSAGHGSALLYSILYLTGYSKMTIEELKNFRQLNSKTPGHVEYDPSLGIDATTGPLGQGIAMGAGMALAERILNNRFGDELINHKTYIICGDGCLAEGIAQEAISIIGHQKLKNLILIFDDNGITIDGPTTLATTENHIDRFKAAGWATYSIDGHNYNQIESVLSQAQYEQKPVFVACKTIIGYGLSQVSGTNKAHGFAFNSSDITNARKELNWPYEPFMIPDIMLNNWSSLWLRNEDSYDIWQKQYRSLDGIKLREYLSYKDVQLIDQVFTKYQKLFYDNALSEATRSSSGKILEFLTTELPNLIGGSADLTASNNTRALSQIAIEYPKYEGSYIHYGEREHAMAAMMNGISLHGVLIPYGGTFLAFSDYCRPSIRLSALMKLRVIYVMTHDSIGVGEDGPTHQPIEHLASFRAMPNINVFRPCDAIETFECWQVALKSLNMPSLLVLSRQTVKKLRSDTNLHINKVQNGGYILKEYEADHNVTIFATGSEVEIAYEVANLLEKSEYGTRIISVPCMNLLFAQDLTYRKSLLDNSSLKVAIEAASGFGWERLIGLDGLFFGINEFGLSAPKEILYKHYGLDSESIFNKILLKLKAE